ncbi:helix-turn-helix domain-containing protein [Candidatus Woesebacteria bacterium]|nr:helix-turn-helix domain-containing protein [Candidatus Woesebacteria bacterium]
MNTFPYFKPDNYSDFIASCKRLFSYGEVCTYITYPQGDLSWRADQLEQDFSEIFDHEIGVLRLDERMDKVNDWMPLMPKNKKYVVVANAEYAFQNGSVSIINSLLRYQHEHHSSFSLLFCFDISILSSERRRFVTDSSLFSNIEYFPLYDDTVSHSFLNHMMQRWGMKLERKYLNTIVSECGGHIWLLKQALRLYRENTQTKDALDLSREPTMVFRLEMIWDWFTDSEQQFLKDFIQHKKTSYDNSQEFYYLNKTGLLDKDSLAIPILQRFIESKITPISIVVDGPRLLVNEVNVSPLFSQHEKSLLRHLIKNENTVIDRDRLAEILWKEKANELYSPWAIEQAVKRLRTKLSSLGLPKHSIKTVRNQGYMFQMNNR